jgi:hypothetical protein
MTHPLQATLENRGERWALTMIRDLPHPIEAVWPWLTFPELRDSYRKLLAA